MGLSLGVGCFIISRQPYLLVQPRQRAAVVEGKASFPFYNIENQTALEFGGLTGAGRGL